MKLKCDWGEQDALSDSHQGEMDCGKFKDFPLEIKGKSNQIGKKKDKISVQCILK